ncbi:Hypothetical protein glysoja_024362 [Glycine soja]|uniref:Uncharacterized protein n=1 Tax=Glycine soja TaxID=3848 RepID=A0A0B2NUY0_GLYSO|nr:Hypothetical protein glysoja_024362 [Glycine soja]
MAKPKGSSKPKTSIFLCCFGSSSRSSKESSPTKGSYDPIISKMKKKSTSTSWFSWRRIRLINKNSATYKTVPLEASNISDNHAHYSKSKSKSTLHHKPQAPATNPPPPRPPSPQPAPVPAHRKGPVVGVSVVVVTLVIMLFWGRLCAILCISVWLYCTRRFRKNDEDLQRRKSKRVDLDLDLDSEEYKKKVIMEGLLGRNHRPILSTPIR